MNLKADELILDVRRAVRTELKPTVTTDSQLIDPKAVAGALQRATLWLTPKVVEAYDPAAFLAWPEELQTELRSAVEGFRTAAATVPSNKPATAPQLSEGVKAFDRLKATVQKVALWDWLGEAGNLVNRVEEWAKEFDWVTRRERKKLNELLLGEYALDQLYMYGEGNLYILAPVARFVPGGLGAFDLSLQPSFYITSIYRHVDGAWYIHLDVGQGMQGSKKELISADALKQAVIELGSLV